MMVPKNRVYFQGSKFSKASTIKIKEGENIKLIFSKVCKP